MSFGPLQLLTVSSTSDYTQKSHAFLEATFLAETDDMLCMQLRAVAKVVVQA